jgi:hypothetical protein
MVEKLHLAAMDKADKNRFGEEIAKKLETENKEIG